MGGHKVMAVQPYLIHLRERHLALAIGAELEERLARDGREAIALVPAGDEFALTGANGRGRGVSRGSYGAPHVVALYEEGLLATLESLGLTAYVGVRPEEEPRAVRWASGGAILLPVGTARDLIDAVADHTPWAAHAARLAKFASASRREAILPGPTPPALSRKLAVAGIASPLLLVGLPAAAVGATPAHVKHHLSAKAGATAIDTTLLARQAKTTQQPVPANTQALLNRIERALLLLLQQTRQGTANNAPATQALENQILRLLNALVNAQPKTRPQPATSPQSANPGGTQPGSQGSGSSGSRGSGSQQSPGSQNQNPQDQNQQDQSQQDQSQQDQSQQDQNPQNQNPNSQDQNPQNQNPQDQNPQDQNPQDQNQQDQNPQDQNPQDQNQQDP